MQFDAFTPLSDIDIPPNVMDARGSIIRWKKWYEHQHFFTDVSNVVDTSTVPTSVSDVLLRVGEELRLKCAQRGTWSKADSQLQTGPKYTIRNGELIIKNAGMQIEKHIL